MNQRWKHSLVKTLVWLLAEVCLNSIGTDDLADYSEFVFEKDATILNRQIKKKKS